MKRPICSYLLLFSGLMFPFMLGAQTVKAYWGSNPVEAGDRIVLHLSTPATGPKPISVDISAWSNWFPPENILGQSAWQSKEGSWQSEISLIYTQADSLNLPPLSIGFGQGAAQNTDPLQLVVVADDTPMDLTELENIKDIQREAAIWTDYLPWIGAFSGLLFLAVLIYWLSTGRKAKAGLLQERQFAAPPHELAFRKLRALEPKRLYETDLVAYYADLSFIAREYLERRYQFPALEWPTNDLLKALSGTSFPGQLMPDLELFLHQSDLAKFAKAHPTGASHQQAFQLVWEMVEKTRAL